MARLKISQLPAVVPDQLKGTDVLPVVSTDETKKIGLATLSNYVDTSLGLTDSINSKVSKDANGADFADPEAVRANIGAAPIALATDKLFSSNYASLHAALSAWMAAGGTLVIDRDHTETAAFTTGDGTFLPGKSYRLETLGTRTVTYDGSNTPSMWRLYGEGPSPVVIDVDLLIDGQNKVGTPVWIDFQNCTGDSRRDCTVRGLRVQNCKLHSAVAVGANGLRILGGFDLVHVDAVHIDGVTRAAGTGSAGSYGCAGVQIFGFPDKTANAKRILVENWTVANIGSEDTPGSAAYQDMDGLLIFQYKFGDDDVQAPTIRNGRAVECVGRAVKRYSTALGGVTENIIVARSVRGKTTGAYDISHQDGSGEIRDCDIHLSGDANVEPSVPVSITASGLDSGGGSIRRVNIYDTTGAPLLYPVSLYKTGTDAYRRHYILEDIRHTGTAQAFVRLGALGLYSDCHITMRNIDVEVTQGVGQDDAYQYYLKVEAFNFINRGSAVPVMVDNAGAMFGFRWGDWWGDEATQGVHRYVPVWRGNAAFKNGFRGPGGGCLDAPAYGESEVFGRTPLGRFTIANNETLEMPPFGSYQSNGGDFTLMVRRVGTGATVSFSVEATRDTTTLTPLLGTAPSEWSVLSTGAASGSGSKIELWKDATTQAPRITNYSGGDVTVEVVFNPF